MEQPICETDLLWSLRTRRPAIVASVGSRATWGEFPLGLQHGISNEKRPSNLNPAWLLRCPVPPRLAR
jgi:hypothetical protein